MIVVHYHMENIWCGPSFRMAFLLHDLQDKTQRAQGHKYGWQLKCPVY
jgi:hypothetical protein